MVGGPDLIRWKPLKENLFPPWGDSISCGLDEGNGHASEAHGAKNCAAGTWEQPSASSQQNASPRSCSYKEMNSANSLDEFGSGAFPTEAWRWEYRQANSLTPAWWDPETLDFCPMEAERQ